MKQKINILIITSIVALLALSGIQAYLIHNTFQLKKEVFIKKTKESVSKLDDTEKIDSLGEVWYGKLVEGLLDYKKNKLLKQETVEQFKPHTDTLNMAFKKYYQEELEKADLSFDLKYKKVINSIVIFDNDQPSDTIFMQRSGGDDFIFGENFPDNEGIQISKARWFTEHDSKDDKGEEVIKTTLDLEIKTTDSVSIVGWERMVLKQMSSLFVFSLLLLLFVVGLLFYSIQNLIKQKKIADVRNDFINNITHELKTPMATLGIASKSLRKKEIQDSVTLFSNALDIVDRQNNRLQNLVDQVMHNTLGAEELLVRKEQILDNSYFEELINDFQLSVQGKNVAVISKIEHSEVFLFIDKFLFTTAMLNILDNAVKYGRDKVEITLKTEATKKGYKIAIRDNGFGISEKEKRKIFDKFYRVHTGDIHEVKGLGLGLFYTDQIIKAHQGTIELDTKIDQGSTFVITIPIEA